MKRTALNFLTLLAGLQLPAQELLHQDAHAGFNVSANMAFGTHFQRLGINLNFFYVSGHVQASSEVRMYFNLKSPGPEGFYPELVLAQGIAAGYGSKAAYFNPFINSVSNQTGYLNSVAYSYNAWFNAKGTQQQTGIVAIEVQRFSLITENDLLARGYYDRFRTAAFLLQYQHKDQWQAAMSCSMWTGQHSRRTPLKTPAFYHGCYMDTAGGRFTNISHGLLSAQFRYNIGLGHNVQANLGVDAEQVRNVMQNKLIHDMRFIPQKWNKANNCHIPMLDRNGQQYLYKEGQKVRPPELFWNVFSNANIFY